MNDSTPKRQCSKCLKVFPATLEYFHKSKRGLFGLHSQCKICKRKYAKNGNKPDPIAQILSDVGLKKCTQCKIWKPATQENFYTDKRLSSGLHSWCRNCKNNTQRSDPNRSKRRRLHYRLNKQHELENNKKYHEEHKSEIKKRQSAYRKTEGFKKSKAKHRRKPDVYKTDALRSKIRYHAKRSNTAKSDSINRQQWESAKKYFNYRCAVCGKEPNEDQVLAIDHWIPISKGGLSTVENIVPLCHGVDGCNNSKKDKDPLEWLILRYGDDGRNTYNLIKAYLDLLKP